MTSAPLSRRRALGTAAGVGVTLPTLAACAGAGESTSSASTPTSDGPPSGDGPLTTVDDVPIGGGVILEEVVVTQPSQGDFRGFLAICTHQGCKVAEVAETINCFCHGAKFDLETGEPVSGPANAPLASLDLVIDGERITLA